MTATRQAVNALILSSNARCRGQLSYPGILAVVDGQVTCSSFAELGHDRVLVAGRDVGVVVLPHPSCSGRVAQTRHSVLTRAAIGQPYSRYRTECKAANMQW